MHLVGCSFCVTEQAPAWAVNATIAAALLFLVGLCVGIIALRSRGKRRIGCALIAVALLVTLPLAALSVRAGKTTIELDPAYGMPEPGQPWRVTCEAAVLQVPPPSASPTSAAAIAACDAASAQWRATAVTLATLSAVFTTIGLALLLIGSARDEGSVVDVAARAGRK